MGWWWLVLLFWVFLAFGVGFVMAVGYLREIRDAVVRMAPSEAAAESDGGGERDR